MVSTQHEQTEPASAQGERFIRVAAYMALRSRSEEGSTRLADCHYCFIVSRLICQSLQTA